MTQVIPETQTNKDWPRRVAQAVNGGLNTMAALLARIVALETHTVETITFTPIAQPVSPVEGMTYQDSTSHKLRTYDGTIWRDHW